MPREGDMPLAPLSLRLAFAASGLVGGLSEDSLLPTLSGDALQAGGEGDEDGLS